MGKPKVLVIVGPTASGKTSLSITLARRFNGEIVSADSRQVYRGLDLGTGKITKDEMSEVPHHLLDVADPKNTYTVADYVRDGQTAITSIFSRSKLPIIVGGTFLYIDALLGKISTPEVLPNEALRIQLELLSKEVLFKILIEKDPVRALTIDKENKRRLIRALEIVDAIGVVPPTLNTEPYNTLTLGIDISKEKLVENIHKRLLSRLQKGMIDEVKNLHKNGLSYERLKELGIEYEYIVEYLENKISNEEMLLHIEMKSAQYAKRQMTWLKRDKSIVWVKNENVDEIEERVREFLSSEG